MSTELRTVNIRGSLNALSAAKENINRATRSLGTPDRWQAAREIGIGALIAIPTVLFTIWLYQKKVKELAHPVAVGEGFDLLGID